MAVTFRDFIVECELYPYSREHFEIVKECSELALTEQFIQNQIVMSNYKQSLLESGIELEDNYLQESVDSVDLEIITEKFNGKVSSLASKMINMVMKVFSSFAKFFGKIGNKFDSITTKGQDVRKKLNSITMTDEHLDKIRTIVNTAKTTESSAFPIKKNQPYKKHVNLKYGGHAKDLDEIRDALAVALSDKTVIAEALLTEDGDHLSKSRIGIMDPDEIKAAGITLTIGKEREIINVASNLFNSWKHVKINGLEIDINTKNINKTAHELNQLCDKIKELINKGVSKDIADHAAFRDVADQAGKAIAGAMQKGMENRPFKDDSDESKYNEIVGGIIGILGNLDNTIPKASEISKAINDAISLITSAIGETTKVYIQLNAYRQNVITALDAYLKNIK